MNKREYVIKYKLTVGEPNFKGAQLIEDMGFFIGLHTKKISSKTAKYIANKFLNIDLIK